MTGLRDATIELRPSLAAVTRVRDVSEGMGVEPRASLRLVRRCGWAVILLAVFSLVAELATRLDDRIRFGVPLLSRVRSSDDLLVHDRDGWHGRPDARYRKWSMDSLGLR